MITIHRLLIFQHGQNNQLIKGVCNRKKNAPTEMTSRTKGWSWIKSLLNPESKQINIIFNKTEAISNILAWLSNRIN